jgi:glycosyltransferase involved in cell wall biosynthesis
MKPPNNRVLMLLENQAYPQDHRVRREAVALASAGYRVSVICPATRAQVWREVVDGVHVYRFPSPAPANGFLGYLWEYGYCTAMSFFFSLWIFWREGFDVVHVHNPPDTFAFIGAFFKLFGKRLVFDHHDLSPEMYRARFTSGESKTVYNALVLLERLACRLADHIIATNESYKKTEIERHHVPAERITVVRNGVEVPCDRPVPPDHGLRRKRQTIIGFLGVMGFQDGMDYLIRALHHLRYDLGRRDFYCVLMGGGDALASVTKLARELGLEEHVWFPGLVEGDRLVRYLSAADICVDPDPGCEYNDRSTMIKMMEYMAYAKPIVAFDLREHRVTAESAASYVKPNDELAFARALAELMDDPAKRKAMGAFGRQRIETQLAWHYSIPNLLAVYRKVLPKSVVAEHRAVPQQNAVRPGTVGSRQAPV